MPRLTSPAAQRVHAAADRFVDSALRSDDSLFTPGTPIWSTPIIDDLYERFVEHPDESDASFEQKFQRQLRGETSGVADADPTVYQLAGELLYMYYLPTNLIHGATKRRGITTVLQWSSAPVAIPDDLAQALDSGVAAAGMYYKMGKPFQLAYLLRFVRQWKQLAGEEQARLLRDPWAFKQHAFAVPVGSAYAMRELLLYLVHPEAFEPIMAREHKQQIAAAFAPLVDATVQDVDQQLAQIRAAIAPEYGAEFHFYEPQIAPLWQRRPDPVDDDGEPAPPAPSDGVTGAAAGLNGARQIRIALAEIVAQGGSATMQQIAAAVQRHMNGQALSRQGLASLRYFVNRVAVQQGYIHPYDRANPGWRITDAGRALLSDDGADANPFQVLPRSLGTKLRTYIDLARALNDDAYTPDAIREQFVRTVALGEAHIPAPDADRLVDDLMLLRLLEPLDDGRYRRWPHLGDATLELLLRYAALTLLVPAGEDAYDLPALEAPFTGTPHPPERWPLGEPLLHWYEEAGLVQRTAEGTWQSQPDALAPLSDNRPTAQAINTFLANLQRARSAPADLPALTDAPLRTLAPAILQERIREIQRELLIDSETILRIYRSLIAGHHVILSGPPGTGKTHLARLIPRILWRDETDTVRLTLPNDPALAPTESPLEEPVRREGYLVEVVTATEDWGVRHVIGGIAPKLQRNGAGTTLVYSVAHGCLTSAVLANYVIDGVIPADLTELPRREHTDSQGNRYRGLWLIIDEFTRAQVDAAFGGLLTTLGGQRRPTLSFPTDEGERSMHLPRDFRLIGTLNSFDRHFLNQISEAMKRRFTFIDVLPPGRDMHAAEQAMAIYRAIGSLADHGLAGFSARSELGQAAWAGVLSVRRADSSDTDGVAVRYSVEWPTDAAITAVLAGLWRVFSAARVYRRLGTAQAEAAYRTLFAGVASGLAWNRALDSALADTLADQLQVIARDELRALLLLLNHSEDIATLTTKLIELLKGIAGPRQNAHLLQLHLIDPTIDTTHPDALTPEQVERVFGPPNALPMAGNGLFAQRLIGFVNEQIL